jgi:O-antigen/teichoic acid export membrane protein
MGIEDFKTTVMRNLILKVISILAIFTFVKTVDDLWIYILINSVSNFIGQAVLWRYVPKIVNYSKVSFDDIKIHILPSLKLFIPTIATQIYCIFDKTLLGYLSSTNEVGLYDTGQKIINMSLTIVTSIGTVMLPMMTNVFSKGNINKVREYLIITFNVVSYISIPMVLGLMAISNGFAIWFFGNGFIKSGNIMMIESPIFLLISWSNIIGLQYMLPLGKSKEYTFSVTIGAIVDVIANLILIKSLCSIGAAISTVLAELAVTSVQIFLMRNYLPFKSMFKEIWKYSLAGLTMYIILLLFNKFFIYNLIFIIIRIIVGIFIYFLMLLILKSYLQNNILNTIKSKILHLKV